MIGVDILVMELMGRLILKIPRARLRILEASKRELIYQLNHKAKHRRYNRRLSRLKKLPRRMGRVPPTNARRRSKKQSRTPKHSKLLLSRRRGVRRRIRRKLRLRRKDSPWRREEVSGAEGVELDFAL